MAPPTPRFVPAAPLPSVSPVLVDGYNTGVGFASQVARNRFLQARILWIDGTANLDKVDSEEKIVALVQRIKNSGFNTIVFDIKPISGQTLYKSALRPKIEEWKGKRLPLDFDPLPIMVREAKANRIPLWASLNAFSEGHSMFKVGPGYATPERQTVMYEPQDALLLPSGPIPVAVRGLPLAADRVSLLPQWPADLGIPSDGVTVALRANGTVVEIADGRLAKPPKNGVLLAAAGAAGARLRELTVGSVAPLGTTPTYIPISQQPKPQIPLMMNPHDPVVREDEIRVAEEVAATGVDGIVYDDRLRYANQFADFSEGTRALFEAEVGEKLVWPTDVFEATLTPQGTRGIRPGRFYDGWMAWRAATLGGWVREVRSRISRVKPGIGLGLYAGSWYGEYAALGNNWAAEGVPAGFWFLDPKYRATGMAGLFDFVTTGCYYPTATIHDAFAKGLGIGQSVEAAGALSDALVDNASWTYAGIALSDFKDDPDGLLRALQAATAATQGVMVFDLSHDIDPMWSVFGRAFSVPKRAPHSVPDLLADLRRRAKFLPPRTRPIITFQGGAGTGQ